jgi:DNA-binding response OmpR family regulator
MILLKCGVEIHYLKRMVVLPGGKEVKLTPTQFVIVRHLIESHPRTVDTDDMLHEVYGDVQKGKWKKARSNLSTQISTTRRRVGAEFIVTRRGVGTYWNEAP